MQYSPTIEPHKQTDTNLETAFPLTKKLYNKDPDIINLVLDILLFQTEGCCISLQGTQRVYSLAASNYPRRFDKNKDQLIQSIPITHYNFSLKNIENHWYSHFYFKFKATRSDIASHHSLSSLILELNAHAAAFLCKDALRINNLYHDLLLRTENNYLVGLVRLANFPSLSLPPSILPLRSIFTHSSSVTCAILQESEDAIWHSNDSLYAKKESDFSPSLEKQTDTLKRSFDRAFPREKLLKLARKASIEKEHKVEETITAYRNEIGVCDSQLIQLQEEIKKLTAKQEYCNNQLAQLEHKRAKISHLKQVLNPNPEYVPEENLTEIKAQLKLDG